MNSIHELLEVALASRASDLILKTDARPALRVDGIMHLLDRPVLNSTQTRELCQEIIFCAARDILLRSSGDTRSLEISDDRLKELKEHKEIDLVFTIPNQARVRASLYLELGEFGAALRIIPLHPYTIEQLDLPLSLKKLALEPHGLILITGPIGSGKTTTMAAMIEEINQHRSSNIFTLEDPVEYIIPDKLSLVHQREIGVDSENFSTALRSVLRQCPDVIAIGELRDRETIEAALSAAETGHLVLSTMHTTSAVITIDRLINSVPIYLRAQVWQQISSALVGVISQRLVRKATGKGRMPAVEVLTMSPTVRKGLEEGEPGDLYSCMRDGYHFGMNTLNQSLELLVRAGKVEATEAQRVAVHPSELRQMLRSR